MVSFSFIFRNCCNRKITNFARQKYIWLLFILICVTFLYVEINKAVEGTYSWKNKGRFCRNKKEENTELLYLVRTTHKILDKLKIDHFLLYGSLWGALRFKQPLPWDYDFDIGVAYNDIKKVDKAILVNEFHNYNIKLLYQYYAGNYKVEYGKYGMSGDLMIFRDYYDDGIMRRIGIESWLFFVHYRYYHQFPSKLIQRPMPKMMFGGLEFNVPHGGIEIQKYLYPTNWWKIVSPAGCEYNVTDNFLYE